jgi:hypothetical protein
VSLACLRALDDWLRCGSITSREATTPAESAPEASVNLVSPALVCSNRFVCARSSLI